jgi:23S rRNA (guanosine2251-2'-O)-methyltransferase
MATTIKLVEPAQNEFLADLEKRSNRPNHFFRTMANRPEVLKNFVPFYGSIMGAGSVDRRTKELVYLTVSYTNKCAYCTAAHVASGRKAGVTEQEMGALQAEQDGGFSAPERALDRILIAKGAADRACRRLSTWRGARRSPVRFEPRAALDRLAGTPAHQGVVAMGAAKKYAELDDVAPSDLIVVLDGVEDPHNLGAIIRTAHAAGRGRRRHSGAARRGVTDVVAKAAAGALEHLPVTRVTNINRTLEELKESGHWIYGLDERGAEDYDRVEYSTPTCWFWAAKARAARAGAQALRRAGAHSHGGQDSSLNVSVAAGSCCSNGGRRRK